MKHDNIRFPDVEAEAAVTMRTASQRAALAGANTIFADRNTLLFVFRPIHELVEATFRNIDFKLQMKSAEFSTRHNLTNKEVERKRLEKERNESKEREVTLAAYAKPRTGRLKRIGMTFLLVFLSVVESIFNQAGLEKLFKTTYVGSLLLGLGLAVLFALIAHEGVPRYLEVGNRQRRMAIAIIAATLAFLMFGILRMDGLPTDVPNLVRLLSFCVISTISYVASCLIGQRLWDAKKQAPTDDEARAAKELAIVRKRIVEIDQRLEEIKRHSDEQEVYNAHLAEYGTGLKQKVAGEARSIFFDFLKTAHSNREAGSDSDIFKFTDYPFTLAEEVPQKKGGIKGAVSAILLMVAASFFSCNPDKPAQGDIAITVLIDQSVESPQQYPDADALLRFCGLRENMWQGEIRINVSKISDVDYEPTYTHILEGAERWNSNQDMRSETLEAFSNEIGHSLAQVRPLEDANLLHSIIYRTLARHAMELQGIPYKQRYLIVFSDLLENSDGINFYGTKGRKLLKQQEKLEGLFKEQVPLGDLSGVTIYFIHRPDDATNADFLAASGFFQTMFQKHHAVTRISATLPNP